MFFLLICSNGCYCDDNDRFAQLLASTDTIVELNGPFTLHPQDFSSYFRAEGIIGNRNLSKITIEVDDSKSINLFSVLDRKSLHDIVFEINTTIPINGDGIIKSMNASSLNSVYVYINGKLVIDSSNEKISILCNEMKYSDIYQSRIEFDEIEVNIDRENSYFGLFSSYISDPNVFSYFYFSELTIIGNKITIKNDKRNTIGLLFGLSIDEVRIGGSVIIIKSELNIEANNNNNNNIVNEEVGLFIGNCVSDSSFSFDSIDVHLGKIDNFGGLIGKENQNLEVNIVLIRFHFNDGFDVNGKFGLIGYSCVGDLSMSQSYVDLISNMNTTESINANITVKELYSYSGSKIVEGSYMTISGSYIEIDDSNNIILLSSYCIPSDLQNTLSNFAKVGSSFIILKSTEFYYNGKILKDENSLNDIVGLTCVEIIVSPSVESIEFINTHYNLQQLTITLNPPEFVLKSNDETRAIIFLKFNESYYSVTPSIIELNDSNSNSGSVTIYPKDIDRSVSSVLSFEVISKYASINNYQINDISLSTIFDGIAKPKLLSCKLKDDGYVIELIFDKKCVMKGIEINKPFKMNDTELLIFDSSTVIDILYYIWINDNTLSVYYNSTTEEVRDSSTITIKEGYIFPDLDSDVSSNDTLPIEPRTPVPQVLSSEFFYSTILIIITFDREIKDGIDVGGRRCSEIFNDTSFNPSSMCHLSSPNDITMELVNPSTIKLNDKLHFIPNVIKSSKNHVKGCEGTIILSGDGHSYAYAEIELPKTISPCYDFIIDGSGSRSIENPLIYHWSSTNETLNSIVSSTDEPMVLIPQNTLDANNDYDISLEVVNTFINASSIVTKTFTVGSDLMLNVEIEGDGEFMIPSTQSLYVRGRVSLYQCDKSVPKPEIDYNWSVKDYNGDLIDVSKYKIVDETRLFFDINSFEQSCTVTLSYSVNNLNDRDSIRLSIGGSGGSTPEISPAYINQNKNEPIIIDLSILKDIIMDSSNPTYNWNCKFNGISYCDNLITDPRSPILEIPSSVLEIGVYELEVRYGSRFTKTYTREITDLPFSVYIQNPKSNSSVYNQEDMFQLECVTSINDDEMKYNWIYSNSENVNPFIGKTDYSKVSINCENLKPRITHKIIFEALYQNKKVEMYYEFTINEAPYNGYLSASALNYRFGDNILLSTVGWISEANDFTYRFGVIINNSTYYLQAVYGLANYYFGPLPIGSSQYNYTLIPIVFVKDGYGAVTSTTLDKDFKVIEIYSPPLRLSDLSNITEELKDVIDDLRNEKYYDYIYPIINGISSQMKQKDCLNLRCENGAECLDGHCQCLDGFYGDLCENRIPIDGGLSSDYIYGECDHKCGKGLKPKWKECNNPIPEYGGKECEIVIEYEECIGEDGIICEDNDGNWSEWSGWSKCNSICEVYNGKRKYGIKTRSRNCTNPKPSGNGFNCIGDSFESKECYIECESVRKLCPGEYLAKNKTIVGYVCGNRGNCIVSREGCKEFEPNCHSKCECEEGYKGENCEYTTSEYEARLNLNIILLSSLIEASSNNVLSYDATNQQSSVLLSIVNPPDQFIKDNKTAIVSFIKSSIKSLLDNSSYELSYDSMKNYIKSTSLLLKDEWKDRKEENMRMLQQSLASIDIGKELPELFNDISEMHLKQERSIIPLEINTDVFNLKAIKYDGTIDIDKVEETVEFPDSIVKIENKEEETKEISIIEWLDNPTKDDLEMSKRTAGMTTISIMDKEGEEKKINNLEKPVYFIQRLNGDSDLKHIQCSYYVDRELQSHGLIVMGVYDDNGNKFVICASTHLSDFSTRKKSILPKMNLVNPISDANLLGNYNKDNMIVPIVLGSVVVICVVSWIIVKMKDMDEFSTLETHKSDYFKLTGRLDDKETDCIIIEKKRKNIFQKYWDMLLDEHSWLSPQLGPTENLIIINRSQRILCLTAQILTSTAVNALFFGNNTENLSQLAMTSIISTLCMLPCSIFIPYVYKFANGYSSKKSSRKKVSTFKLIYMRLKRSIENIQKKKTKLYLTILDLVFDGLTACFFIIFVAILPPGYITLMLFCIYVLFIIETIALIVISSERNKKYFYLIIAVNVIIFIVLTVLLVVYILCMNSSSTPYSIWKVFYNGGALKDINEYIESSLECCGYKFINDYNTTDCTVPKIMALGIELNGCESLLVDKFNQYAPLWIIYFVISMIIVLMKIVYLVRLMLVIRNVVEVNFEFEELNKKYKDDIISKKSADKIKCMLKYSVNKMYYKRKIEYLHLKRQRRVRAGLIILANSFVFLYILIMVYINLLYGVKFTTNQAKDWILSSTISMIIDVVIQQPAMILLSTVASTTIGSLF